MKTQNFTNFLDTMKELEKFVNKHKFETGVSNVETFDDMVVVSFEDWVTTDETLFQEFQNVAHVTRDNGKFLVWLKL
jgi:hypothetical protein